MEHWGTLALVFLQRLVHWGPHGGFFPLKILAKDLVTSSYSVLSYIEDDTIMPPLSNAFDVSRKTLLSFFEGNQWMDTL